MASEREITLVHRLHGANHEDPHEHEPLDINQEHEEEDEDHTDSSDDDEEQDEEDMGSGEAAQTPSRSAHGTCFSGILCGGPGLGRRGSGSLMGRVLDPRASWFQEWNRVFLLVCTLGLFVDPLFFYVLSISESYLCLFIDGWFAITVTVLRCMMDALHVWNMWLQLKMARHPYGGGAGGGGAGGGGPVEKGNGRAATIRYLKTKKGFFFDFFVIIPLPQKSFN